MNNNILFSLSDNCSCVNEKNKLIISGSSLSLIDGSIDLDLSKIAFYKCDLEKKNIQLLENSSVVLSGSMIALASDSSFLISDASTKSLNLSLNLSWDVIAIGNVDNYTIAVSVSTDASEQTYNWFNFDNRPFNYNRHDWSGITGSWSYYSTINQTSSCSTISSNAELSMQTVDSIDATQNVLVYGSYGEILDVEITVVANVPTITNISVLGTIETIDITVSAQSQHEYLVFLRNMLCFSDIDGIYIENCKYSKTFVVKNINKNSITINSLSGATCDQSLIKTTC